MINSPNEKSLATLLTEMKEELKEFGQTRIAMFKAELQEKLTVLKAAAPLGLAAILLLGTAYLLFTLALVALAFALLPEGDFRAFFAFLAVGILWAIIGAIAGWLAVRQLQTRGLLPKRTVDMLKGDKNWIQSEVKNQI